MSLDVRERLEIAYPEHDLSLPDPSRLWSLGRRRRRRRHVTRSIAAVAAASAVVVSVAGIARYTRPSEPSAPYIAGVQTVDVTAAEPMDLDELPVLAEGAVRAELMVGAIDGMIALAHPQTYVWKPTPELADTSPVVIGRGNRLVIWADDRVYAMEGDVDADLHPIATADDIETVVPSDHPQRVWLRGRIGDLVDGVWEVASDGSVTVEPLAAPDGRLVAAVRSGIVLDRQGSLLAWDPRRRQTLTTLDGSDVIGAAGDSLVWCDNPCDTIQLTNVGRGTTRAVARIEGEGEFQPTAGQLSPDGRWLAALFCVRGENGRCGSAVIDLVRGGVTMTAFGAVPADTDVEWSQRHDRLIVRLTDGHVGIWEPEAGLRRSDQSLNQEHGRRQIGDVALVPGRVAW